MHWSESLFRVNDSALNDQELRGYIPQYKALDRKVIGCSCLQEQRLLDENEESTETKEENSCSLLQLLCETQWNTDYTLLLDFFFPHLLTLSLSSFFSLFLCNTCASRTLVFHLLSSPILNELTVTEGDFHWMRKPKTEKTESLSEDNTDSRLE